MIYLFNSYSKARFFVNLCIFLLGIFILDRAIGYTCAKMFDKVEAGDFGGSINGLIRNESELVIFGSSRAAHQYDVAIFEDSLKMRTYNAGNSAVNSIYHYAVLKMLLKHYTPQVIIFDFTNLAIDQRKRDPYKYIKNLNPHYADKDVFRIISETSWFEKYFFTSKIYPYNSIMPAIAKYYLHPESRNKGYYYLTETYNKKEIGRNIEKFAANPIKEEYLLRFIKLAKEHNIKLFFCSSPRFLYGKYGMSDKVKNENIVWIDYDIATHPEYYNHLLFHDEDHLNKQGAEIFSRDLAAKLKKLLNDEN